MHHHRDEYRVPHRLGRVPSPVRLRSGGGASKDNCVSSYHWLRKDRRLSLACNR